MWPGPASAERWYRRVWWAHRRGDRQRRQSEHTRGRGVAAASLVAIEPGQETALGQELHGVAPGIGSSPGSIRFAETHHLQITGGIAISSGTAGAWAASRPGMRGRTTAKRQRHHGDLRGSTGQRAAGGRRRLITAAVPKAVAAPSASTVDTGPVVTGAPVPALGTWWTGVPPPDPAPG